MTFSFKYYRIISYEYGYKAQRKIGKQWKIIGYYENLKNAVKDTFKYRILTETTNNVIDATNEACIRLESAKLLKKIECIANEIEEVFKHEQ